MQKNKTIQNLELEHYRPCILVDSRHRNITPNVIIYSKNNIFPFKLNLDLVNNMYKRICNEYDTLEDSNHESISPITPIHSSKYIEECFHKYIEIVTSLDYYIIDISLKEMQLNKVDTNSLQQIKEAFRRAPQGSTKEIMKNTTVLSQEEEEWIVPLKKNISRKQFQIASYHIEINDYDMCMINGLLLGYPVLYTIENNGTVEIQGMSLKRFSIVQMHDLHQDISSFTVPSHLVNNDLCHWIEEWFKKFYDKKSWGLLSISQDEIISESIVV